MADVTVKPKEEHVEIRIRVPRPTLARLEAHAAISGRDRSELTVMALDSEFPEYPPAPLAHAS